jgi:hypothetical protein
VGENDVLLRKSLKEQDNLEQRESQAAELISFFPARAPNLPTSGPVKVWFRSDSL